MRYHINYLCRFFFFKIIWIVHVYVRINIIYIRDILLVLLDEMDYLHITMTSHWARWRLKSPASQLFTQAFIQAQMKENSKAPRRWPLWGEFTAHRIHRSSVTSPHKGPASGKCFHLMTSSWIFTIISSTIIFYDLYCRQGRVLWIIAFVHYIIFLDFFLDRACIWGFESMATVLIIFLYRSSV